MSMKSVQRNHFPGQTFPAVKKFLFKIPSLIGVASYKSDAGLPITITSPLHLGDIGELHLGEFIDCAGEMLRLAFLDFAADAEKRPHFFEGTVWVCD